MPQNMSYCRFQNTLAALRECDEALSAIEGDPGEPGGLSADEYDAFKRLVKLCRSIADSYEDIQ